MELFEIINTDLVLRIFLLVVIVMYGFFALVLAFQVRSLNSTVRQRIFSSVFTFLSFAHAIIAMGLLVFAIILL